MASVIRPQDHKQHLLKPSTSDYIPRIWLFLDTETSLHTVEGISSHYFTLGWTCLWKRSEPLGKDSQEWIFHRTHYHFNKYLEGLAEMYKNLNVIGHNIFFDLQASGFYEYFTQRGWKLKFYYDKGLTYILKAVKQKSSITLISSTNWFDFSLEKLGQALGYPKLLIDFDGCSQDELKVYCRRDVEILVQALKTYIDFIVTHDLGKFCLTKASQAFTAYRHKFMPHKILIHSNDEVIKMERDAYIGGRCECFHIGNIRGGPFITLDVNSMYPYVMQKYEYPWKLVSYYVDVTPDFVNERLSTFAVIVNVDVEVTEPVFAVKAKGKTIFPVGKFNCSLATTGFKYGFNKGYIVKVNQAAFYRKADLFSGYVSYFHNMRVKFKNEGNDIFLLLCKYMHNSLYGKFGQLNIVSELEDFNNGGEYTREDVYNIITGRIVTITHLMNQRLIQYSEGEGANSNVAIAAHITENARFYLWSIIQKIGKSRVLYCDTDSVKIRVKDLPRVIDMIDPGKLGKLKIEDTSETLILEGAKNYRTEHKRKIKGIPKKAVETSPGVFTFESFVRQVSHLRDSQITGAQMRTITRTLKHKYNKGNVSPSGRVTPFNLSLPLPLSEPPQLPF